jgi:hypothetical protein
MNYRELIETQVGKVPTHVLQGSVQKVVRWKELANDALRLAKNKNASDYELRIALDRLK